MQMQTVFNILNHWNRLILGLGQSLRLFRLKVSQRRSLSLREQPQSHPTSTSWQFSSSVFIFLFFKAGPSSSSSSCSSSDSCSFNENGDVSLLGLLLLGFEKIFNSINFRFENLVLVLVKIFYFRVKIFNILNHRNRLILGWSYSDSKSLNRDPWAWVCRIFYHDVCEW